MDQARESHSDINVLDERLGRAFYATGRYNPLFLGVTGIGFFALYLLTRLDIFGEPAPQLIGIGISAALLALAQIPILDLARRNHGIAANIYGSIAVGIFAVLVTAFWERIVLVMILLAVITPITAWRAGFPRRYLPVLLVIAGIAIVGILYVNNISALHGIQNGTPVAYASFAFLLATGLLLVTITLISGNRNFRSLQTLLLTSFIVIVTIPTLLATTLSTIGAFTSGQTQTFSTLQAVTNLKEGQISSLIHGFETDTRKIQSDPGFSVNALSVLTNTGTVESLLENSRRVVRSRVKVVLGNLGNEDEQYTEVMVLNTQGQVVISTMPEHEGLNFDDQLFFRQGTLRLYTGFADVPVFGEENLIVAAPIYGIDGRVIRGVVALRSKAASIKSVMESTPGFENAETYLVDKNYRPVTQTRVATQKVSTQASLEAILNNVEDGQDIYENYNGERVLGNYKWFDAMQVALIAEVPLSFVISSSLRSLVGSAVLALFVISIAIAAVALSARSIVHPITALAETSENFAAGKLTARAAVDRRDEIGTLARSYNQMASQLQEVIGRLEQRVADRTKDLETQTFRLRVTAEISRDVASSHDLSELLERSAQLMLNRFGFSHVGIFLLDNNKEYAVLAASPTAMGTQMLADHFQLRVGQAGIVGRVAATGEPRISRDTDSDAVHLLNPLLPDTRSEMALPLKTERNVVGVLDIQSDIPQAFTDDDVAILQILADQLATSIERTRLLQEVEHNLRELESAYGQFTRENWMQVLEASQAGKRGYRFDNIRLEKITEVPEAGQEALEKGIIISSRNADSSSGRQETVAVPIKLRGQTIGVINLKLKEGYSDETISTVEQAGERLASAFESARLYEEARQRADREQSIAQVTTAISSSISYEEILQTTVREIGTTLPDTEVSIEIISELKDGK
jgi:GAF domain-containing protein/HAMP domain-containing protein